MNQLSIDTGDGNQPFKKFQFGTRTVSPSNTITTIATLSSVFMFGGFKSVQRFSLLLLEEREDYLQEYVVECRWPLEVDGNWSSKPVLSGTLRLCTKSLFFEADDIRIPVVRFPFKFIQHLEPIAGKSFTITTSGLTKMKANNADQPYVHMKHKESHWHFSLLYAVFDRFLQMVTEQMALKDNEELMQQRMQERVDGASFDASRLVDFSETILHEGAATHILPLVREPGKMVVTNLRLYYQPLTSVTGFNLVRTHPLDAIAAVSRRRSSLKPCGLEVFFVMTHEDNARSCWDSSCAFFEFRTQEERDKVLNLLFEKIRPGNISGGILESHSEWMGRISAAWQLGRMSNFDYVLYLNLASGRTFNDLRQFPVFPWVLQDYTSSILDLDNPESYRDLSKPIGALNPERLAIFRKRFDQMPADGFPPPFLYGTHYSTPGYVMFWLVRAAPAHILQLQSGRFDAPDRMFYSVQAAWDSVMSNPADVKELIPEFFLPNTDFLTNRFHSALGKRQNGKSVDDVELPAWATDPLDFLAKNRAALESEYVSQHLHLWINLIFGHLQTGEAAVQANNVFYYLSYEGAVDIESVEDPLERKGLEAQINEFGQTPKQIFKHPHPPRQVIPPTPDPETVFDKYITQNAGDGLDGNLNAESQHTDNQALSMALLSMVSSLAESELTPVEWTPNLTPRASANAVLMTDPSADHVSQIRIKKSDSIYDRVKQQWGFAQEEKPTRRSSGELRRYVSQTMKGINTRYNNFVDQFNSKLMLPPCARQSSAGADASGIWSCSLLRGMQLRHKADFLQGAVRAMAISPLDGGTLYCAGDNATLKMFSLENGSQIRSARIERVAGKGIPLSGMDLLPHLKPNMQPLALVGSYDNSVYAYSIEFGRLIGFYTAHDDAVSVVKLLRSKRRSSRMITASWDGSVKIWPLLDGRAPWEGLSSQTPVPEIDISDHDSPVIKVAESVDGSVIVSGTDEGVTTAWDLRSPLKPIWKLCYSEASVGGLALVPDGEHVLCGFGDGTVKLWSVKKPDKLISTVKCETPVHGCLTDGFVSLHGQENGTIAVWHVGQFIGKSTGYLEEPLPNADGFYQSLQCSENSIIHATCVQTVKTLEESEMLWVAAGQGSGKVSFFRST